ncbi:MAG: PTS transporter subunit EIIC [Pelolinea sp.]|nr:PTS transporter subunit EIIC [Pelolinea sp.]
MKVAETKAKRSFSDWLESTMMPPIIKLGGQRHLVAVRDGFMGVIAFLIVGAFFLIIAFPPVQSWAKAVEPYIGTILIPFNLTFAIMSVYVSFGVAYHLARSYKDIDPLMAGITSTATFLILATPGKLDGTWLGTKGLFVAILVGLISVEIYRAIVKSGFVIKMPEGTPPAVTNAFIALVPQAVLVISAWLIAGVWGIILPEVISKATAGFVAAADNVFVFVGAKILAQLQWMVGIHEMTILGATYDPYMTANTMANAEAVAAGLPMPFITTNPLWVSFAHAASVTPLVIVMLLFAKSKRLKMISRLAIIPAIFCISEPTIFGVPIVFNPIMWIPFLLAGIVSMTIGWLATYFGLMSRMFIYPPWTLPAPIYAFVASGGDWRAVVVQLIAYFILGALIYYPFFKIYDKRILQEELTLEKEKEKVIE